MRDLEIKEKYLNEENIGIIGNIRQIKLKSMLITEARMIAILIKLVLKCYIINIGVMGNFTGFQKSDDFYIHPQLGQIKRIQKEQGPQLIQHKVFVDSQDLVQEWRNTINLLENTECSSVLFLPKTHYSQRIGYCGGNCEVFLLYDDFMFCLKDEIKNRRAINRPFSEASVWEMIYKLAKAESLLSKFKLKIGNVSPQNILVNQQGDFRIISQHSWPNSLNNSLIDIELKEQLYSPEQLLKLNNLLNKPQKLQTQKQNTPTKQTQDLQTSSDHEQIKNQEMFSIGATMLQICSLEDSKQIYHNKVVDQDKIIKRLNTLQGKFSRGLIGVLWEMLRVTPQERITAAEIVEALKCHEEMIFNHKPFILNLNFNNPFYTKTVNSQLKIEPNKKTVPSDKKWKGFAVFFPFLRELHQEETVSYSAPPTQRDNGIDKHVALTRAH